MITLNLRPILPPPAPVQPGTEAQLVKQVAELTQLLHNAERKLQFEQHTNRAMKALNVGLAKKFYSSEAPNEVERLRGQIQSLLRENSQLRAQAEREAQS